VLKEKAAVHWLNGSLVPLYFFIAESYDYRGFPKTSVLGKATLDLEEKADFWPLFPKPLPITEET
jgi:hypothetical protein